MKKDNINDSFLEDLDYVRALRDLPEGVEKGAFGAVVQPSPGNYRHLPANERKILVDFSRRGNEYDFVQLLVYESDVELVKRFK